MIVCSLSFLIFLLVQQPILGGWCGRRGWGGRRLVGARNQTNGQREGPWRKEREPEKKGRESAGLNDQSWRSGVCQKRRTNPRVPGMGGGPISINGAGQGAGAGNPRSERPTPSFGTVAGVPRHQQTGVRQQDRRLSSQCRVQQVVVCGHWWSWWAGCEFARLQRRRLVGLAEPPFSQPAKEWVARIHIFQSHAVLLSQRLLFARP